MRKIKIFNSIIYIYIFIYYQSRMPNKFKLNVQDPWFSLIYLGNKTVEGRLAKGKFLEMEKGDYIIFKNDTLVKERKIKKKIVKINKYPSFKKYLEKEKLEKCLPTITNIENGVAVYRQFYNEENEKKYGIIAIQFE